MFNFKYQRIFLTLISFENGILAIGVEFTLILKIEAILIAEHIINFNSVFEPTLYINNLLKTASSIFINDAIYTIIVNII